MNIDFGVDMAKLDFQTQLSDVYQKAGSNSLAAYFSGRLQTVAEVKVR